jgi:hypothetical protein
MNMPLAQIIDAVLEGWQSLDWEASGAIVLMSGISAGLVIWFFEIRSPASHR